MKKLLVGLNIYLLVPLKSVDAIPIEQEIIEVEEEQCVDINRGDIIDLMRLIGIGISKAKLIYEYRDENGKIENIDVMNVKGIGQLTYDKFEEQLC